MRLRHVGSPLASFTTPDRNISRNSSHRSRNRATRGGRSAIDESRRNRSDSGVGLQQTTQGLGTGLSTLRQRLQLIFGGDAQLRVTAHEPRGVCAELDVPVRAGAH